MESFFSFIAGLLLLLGAGRSDLLDTMSTGGYWKAKGVTPTVEVLRAAVQEQAVKGPDVSADIAKLADVDFKVRAAAKKSLEAQGASIAGQLKKGMEDKDPEVAGTCKDILAKLSVTGQANSVKKLMAIRTLGELKDKDSVDLLKSLQSSKELFVAEYASRAIDSITGESHPPAAISIIDDLQLLPVDTGVVAQIRWDAAGTPLRFDTILSRYRMSQIRASELLATAIENRKMIDVLAKKLSTVADTTGNFRLDGVTIGVSKDIGDDTGWVTVILHGLYDHQAVISALKAQGMDISDDQGIATGKAMDDGALFIPSDNLLVYMTAPNAMAMAKAKDAMAKALKAGKGDFAKNDAMAALIKTVDTTKDIWLAGQINDAMKEAPFLAPFSTITLEASREKSVVNYSFKATGSDAAKVKEAVAVITDGIKDVMGEAQQAMTEPGPEGSTAKAATKAMETIKVAANGKDASLTGSLDPASLMTGLMGSFPIDELLMEMTTEEPPGGPGGAIPPGGPGVNIPQGAPVQPPVPALR